jgi:hypothetical protein
LTIATAGRRIVHRSFRLAEPILFGDTFLCVQLPGFVMVLFNSDRESGTITVPLAACGAGGRGYNPRGCCRTGSADLRFPGIAAVPDNPWPNLALIGKYR